MKKLSFPKKLRLLSRHEFSYVLENSYKLIKKEIIVFFKINNFQHPRIGIIITKKNIKHAYKRNNIKRHIRESFRIHQYFLPNIDFIITIQNHAAKLDNDFLKKKLITIWRYKYDANF